MIYGKPYTGEFLSTKRKVQPHEGYVPMVDGLERPTSEHVCSPDGLWVPPKETPERVALKREERYKELGADDLLNEIIRNRELGRDVLMDTEKWKAIQVQVREELPYPEPPVVSSYYEPLLEPTPPIPVPEDGLPLA